MPVAAGQKLRLWTAGEVARLKAFYQAGHSHKAIGKALGRSPHSVANQLHYLGACDRRRQCNQKEIVRLFHCGLSHPEISQQTGQSVSAISRLLRRLGMMTTPERLGQIRRRASRTWIPQLVDRTIRRYRDEAVAVGWSEATSGSQASVLQVILEKGPCRFATIVQGLALRCSVVSYHLQRLERFGQVRRLRRGWYDLAPWLRARKTDSEG